MRAIPLLFFCYAVVWPFSSACAEDPADFSGQWVATDKDADGSNTPPADSHAGSGSHGGGGGHGGMGGHGGSGGGHHGRPSDDTPSGSSASTNAPVAPRLHAHALIIRQSDIVFDVAADGQRMAYRFDNRHNYGAPYGGTVTLTWAEPEMVIETHPDGGGTIEEHYTLAADNQHLNLRIRTQPAGSEDVRETRRVFKRDDGDSAASAKTLP